MKLFEDTVQRQRIVVVAAGIALHAIASREPTITVEQRRHTIDQAFMLAEEFIQRAELFA